MSTLKYVGRYTPGSEFFLAHKAFADDYWAAVKVDNAYIDAQMVDLLATLTTASFVDSRDATKAKKTYVDNQDALYVPTSQRGAAGGVAPLNASTQVPAINVSPSILTDRVVKVAAGPTINWTATHTVLDAANAQEFLGATLAVADPGYPYIPLVFGEVLGRSTTATDPGDGTGTGVYGQAVVFDTADTVWARAATSGNYRTQGFPLIPWAPGAATPTTLSGATTLSMYLSLYSKPSGSSDGYAFTTEGLQFWALLWPGL
jgi:hypothetical protein